MAIDRGDGGAAAGTAAAAFDQTTSVLFAVAGGTVDALTAAFTPTITTFTDGMLLRVRAAGANATTTPTLNVDSLGAKMIVREGGAALRVGDIGAVGHVCLFSYDLVDDRWELLNPAHGRVLQPLDATLTALAGVTTAADKVIYATGSDTFATTDLTSAARSVLDDTTVAAMRTTLRTGAIGVPENYSISASVASNALTIALKTAAEVDASASDPVSVLVPDGAGAVNRRSVTGALSLTISAGSTLGHNPALKQYIYWYLIDNAGTLELAASSKFFGRHGTVTTTAEGGAGAADTGTTMYSTSARVSVPFVCVAYSEDTQTTAGTWAAAPSTIHLAPFTHPVISFSAHKGGTNQAGVTSGVAVAVTFGTEAYDNGGLFSSSGWTPPPGFVRISALCGVTVTVDQTSYRCLIAKNGVTLKQGNRVHGSGTGSIASGVYADDECNGTDVYTINYVHNAGTDRTISGDASETYFMGSWSPGRS